MFSLAACTDIEDPPDLGTTEAEVLVGNFAARFDDTLRGGGVIVAGDTMAGREILFSNPAAEINITTVPAGATVQRALLYWAISGGSDTTLLFEGNIVQGALVATGGATCWPGDPTNRTFRADVTALVPGNGNYDITGLPSEFLLGGADTDGVALVVVYQQASAGNRSRVMVRDGAITTSANGDIATDTFPGLAAPLASAAHFHMIVGDGQPGDAYDDGPLVFAGTNLGTNQWQGGEGSLWDTQTYNVNVTAGQTAATWTSTQTEDCILYVAGVLDYRVAVCGDGVMTGGEACDQGNTTSGDGCAATCDVEPGWSCTGSPSVCTATCGDGIRVGTEQCDDGDTTGGDGCTATCTIEPGWGCTGSPSACTTICGDGVLAGAEACDQGNVTPGDGCSATCTVEPGFGCTGMPSVCTAVCGDGVVAGGEGCDDGDMTGGDGCSATCVVEPGYSCTGTPSVCTTTCGDGTVGGSEACDDGDLTGGDGCSATCTVEPGYACTGSPSVCTEVCGDGVVTGGETCDDGDTTAGDGCDAGCDVEPGWECTGAPSVCTPECGDGVVTGGETCDDGDTTAGDGCSATCAVEPGWSCTGMPSTCAETCGDGALDAGEACDDGNLVDGDGCTVTCTVEPGYECTGEPSQCVADATCGDGARDDGEVCDDGNVTPGDGCSATCTRELGFVCTGAAGAVSTCDALAVAGGGCSAGGAGAGGGALVAVGLALLALVTFGGRRRRSGLALSGAVLAAVVATPGDAAAQLDDSSASYSAERFQLSMDRAGILAVESPRTSGHLAIDVGLWLGYADDPLTVRAGDDRDRLASLVSKRIGGALVGSIGLGSRLELGVGVPLILSQDQDAGDLMTTGSLSSFGVGDLQVTPKVALLQGRLEVALAAAITVPTSSADDFMGEDGITGSPMIVLGTTAGDVRLAFDAGYRVRGPQADLGLQVDDELFADAGAALRAAEGVELMLSFALATPSDDPFGDWNGNYSEARAGVGVDVTDMVRVFGAGGIGLSEGWGAPDWRALAGVWIGANRHKEQPAPPVPVIVETPPAPDPDADHDGIPVPTDQCPDVAENVNGYQDEDGCPDEIPDTDKDGIDDVHDECPGEPEDADGFQDADGCPDADNDGDGVVDGSDRCPMEAGPVENGGCPDADRDADTVVDRLDNCPDEPGTVANHGCKEKQLVVFEGNQIRLLDVVYFKLNKAILEKRSNRLLTNVASVLKAHPEVSRVVVEGHTDAQGDDVYNLDLSQRRAQAVVDYLIRADVPAEKLVPVGHGENVPIADNKTKKGRAANRRVEFKLEGISAVQTQPSGPPAETIEK